MKKIGVVLLAVTLVAGMTGCFTPFRMQYRLTLSSTEGGRVATPGEGTFTYWGGTVVNLVAEADEGYGFVNWTGDACACNIANINAALTSITVNNDYTIIANFAPEISENLEIRDWYDLDAVRNNLGGNHTLMNDLNSATLGYEELASPSANQGKGWEPIGNELYDPYEIHSFTGIFNGQGYKICDLFINRPDEIPVGLFRIVLGGQIENIGVVNVTVTGDCEVGGLVGYINDSNVSNSYATGNITGERYKAGGLVGCMLDTNLSNSYSTGNVNGHSEVGGLVADNWGGTVTNSYSTSNVNGDYNVGGLLGSLTFGTMINSYSSGSVTGDNYVGGLVGRNVDGTVSDSFWDTETSGQATSDGGTGKNTTEMQDIGTFTDTETEGLDEPWDIVAVANPGIRNLSYIWNIVDHGTYPFLSWQSVS